MAALEAANSSQPQIVGCSSSPLWLRAQHQPVFGQAAELSARVVQMEYAEGKVLQDGGKTLCSPAHCRKLIFPS